ncbi:LysR substrate-binding domain-containing protein [Devosia sp.]|uniref:LysR family transcriptional regulator n=1 Tax=Devosia sp. TaxID=1871048 RepID=UPI0032675356
MSELIDIRTFVTAARLGSFAKAARRLDISPAMVGRRVQALEEHYGARLIERTTRSQRLTELGERFLVQAQAVLDAENALGDLTRVEPGQLHGRIRISAPTTLGIRRLPRIVAGFVAAHPGAICEISLSDRRVDLIAEGFDLAVRIGMLPPSSLIVRRIGTYRFICCAAASHVERHGMPQTPDGLQHAPCVLNLNLIPRNRWPFIGPEGQEVTAAVRGGIEIDNGEAQLAAALAGGGAAYLPEDLVRDDLASGRLVRILPNWTMPGLPIQVVHPSRKQVPRRVTAFIDALAEGMRE